jgi:DNA polymerase-3 subunit alpha
MSHAGFVHLRVHSAYSLSEGAITVKDLVAYCRENAMPAVAVTDSANLFGALEFALTARETGVQPVIGIRIDVRADREGDGENGGGAVRDDPAYLVLLVQDETGYRNLLRLVSRAYLESDPGEGAHITYDRLAGHSDGLIALTGGTEGPVGRLLSQGQDRAAEELLDRLGALFPGRLYVELQRHGLQTETLVEDRLVDLAYAKDLPLVATNEAYFVDAETHEAHDALLCIADGTNLADPSRRRLTPEHRLKTAEEMRALFADLPEAIENTLVIARRCSFFPDRVAPILPAFPTEAGRSEAEELAVRAQEGLERRLVESVYGEEMDANEREAAARPYQERLTYELEVIGQMGYAGYFLIVADFIQWANERGIPVGPGRGSGAGSVVAWALTITGLDPLRWGLLFERFLNPERVSMPDFDIDFCQDRRDEVIAYVQEKYGRDQVAQIITFGKLQARAALRDVGRVLGMPYSQVDRICKLVPNNPADPVSLSQAIDGEPLLQAMGEEDPLVARLMDIAMALEGLYRHASTHAAGLVIGDRPLEELVPLYRDPRSDIPVTQFSMKYVEEAGLVKFDFLGLKTLTVLAKACELIAKTGTDVDLATIPLDDHKTFEMLCKAETAGVFQLESSGMRDALRRLRPDRFEDIIAVVALFRPGPMENIPSYIARKHGEEPIDTLHPSIADILTETYGIMIYQEQVMQIAQELAGYSLGKADLLRRAMGKKIKSEMEAQRQGFIEGAVARGVPQRKAETIFALVDKFAGYGFNKSHAAAYALVAYQTAFLKANYPVEFMAATMIYDTHNTDKLNQHRQELQRLGIELLPPDINRSEAAFSVERREDQPAAIRYGLAAVKNVGAGAMAGLVETRGESGPFKSVMDFARRLDARLINKRQVESLAAAGVFDNLDTNRARLFAAAETLVRCAAAESQRRESGQGLLFDGEQAEAEQDRLQLPQLEDWPTMERLRHEFEAIGFYLSAHPLDAYGDNLAKLEILPYSEVLRTNVSGRCKLAGIVIGKRELNSRKGNRMAFVQCSDAGGVFEVTLFAEVLARSRDLLDAAEPLLFNVTVEWMPGADQPRLTVHDLESLEKRAAEAARGLRVFLDGASALDAVRALLEREGRGRGKVVLLLDLEDDREVEVELPGGYRLSPAARQAIKAIPGVMTQDF